MKTNRLIYGALAVLLVVTGWMAGSRQPLEAQAANTAACEWHMFSENVAGTGGSSAGQDSVSFRGLPVYGTSWLYSSCTGEVQRIFDGCGEGFENGCVMSLPVVTTSGGGASFQPNMKLLTE